MTNKLLIFTATWCAPCKMMKPILDLLDQDSLIYYDVDKEIETVKKFKVGVVPTFVVVDKDFNELERKTGVLPIEKVKQMLNV